MFGRKTGSASGITLVANNCELTGDVHFSDHLIVNGVIKGNVYADPGSRAVIEVSEKGRVKGEIRVPRVVVNGKVYGDIHSDKHIELSAKAEVKGNVFYNLIEMVMGSRVDGNLVHVKAAKEVARSQSKAPQQEARPAAKSAATASVSAVQSKSA